MARYDIDALGWVQFERLCDELLRLEGVEPEWEGRADIGRVATIPGGVVALIWVRPVMQARLARDSLLAQLRETLASVAAGRSLRLLTNLDLTPHELLRLGANAGYVGPRELGTLLDREPVVRRRLPSVLGVRDVDELVAPDVLERSSGDIAAARALASVFVPTRAYGDALRVLERHRFAVLTGPPEMGKTAIARMVGLALLTEGWEVHECLRPDDLWSRLRRERPQLFIADDAFGSTEYRPEAADRWALELDRVLRATGDRHWLIWTSRPSPLKAALRRVHREHGVERWPRPAEIHVAADELDVEEKSLILFRHARAATLTDVAIDAVRREGAQIVSHRHFTPERIRRFVDGRLQRLANELDATALHAAVEEEIREPTAAMAASLRALEAEHRSLLLALVDTAPGPVPERELAAAARRHADAGMPKPPAQLVDRLTDHFLRVVPPTSVTWVHPSWRDLVIDELAEDAAARRRFLARCSTHGVVLALSSGGGAEGERTLPLLVDDGDWDAVADRLHQLVETLSDDDVFRTLSILDDALTSAPDERSNRELRALTAETLDVLRRRWNARREPIEPRLLELWLALGSRLGNKPTLPELGPTWVELVPNSAPRLGSRTELEGFDDWLRLAGTLLASAPTLADELGFPQRYTGVMKELIADARRLVESPVLPPTAGLVAQVLWRIADIAPELSYSAHRIAASLSRSEPPEPSYDPLPPPRPAPAAGAIVARILGDLG